MKNNTNLISMVRSSVYTVILYIVGLSSIFRPHCVSYVLDNDATDAVLAAVTAPLVSLTLQQTFRVTSYGLELLVRCCHHTLTSLDLSYSSGVMSVSELTQLEAWFPQLTILCLRWTISIVNL